MGERIVVRAPNHLGDCVMALPMINEVREAHPGAHVTVLAPGPLADLYESNSGVDDVQRIPAEHLHGLISVVRIKDILSAGKYDIGYILPPSFGAAAAFKLSGIKERIGYIADGRRLLLSKPLALPAPLNIQHRSVTYFELLPRATGRTLTYSMPRLPLTDMDREQGRAVLSNHHIDPSVPYVTVGFQANAPSRRWGMENHRELSRMMRDIYSLTVVLIGGPSDAKMGEQIAGELGEDRVITLAGKTKLRETAAIMAGSRMFVGDDSGPVHLAAAVGVPVVATQGAGDPQETGPATDRVRLVYLPHLDCIHCVKNICPLKGDQFMRCLKGVTLPMALKAVDELAQATGAFDK